MLIPDYSLSEINSLIHSVTRQLNEFEKAKADIHYAMESHPTPNPLVYYSASHQDPVFNEVGYKTLINHVAYLKELKSEEEQCPHAFLRRVLALYGKETAIDDKIYIDYDKRANFKLRVKEAWETYKTSQCEEKDLSALKEALKKACNDNNIMDKEITTNIQIPKLNKILKTAGINESVASKRTVFNVISDNDTEC